MFTALTFFLSPLQTNATNHLDAFGGAGPNVAEGLSYKIKTPLEVTNIEGLVVAILNVLLIIAIPVIVFFIIFAGFSYVTAQGNPEKIKTATRSITYALIGGILILGATALTEVIKNIVGEFTA